MIFLWLTNRDSALNLKREIRSINFKPIKQFKVMEKRQNNGCYSERAVYTSFMHIATFLLLIGLQCVTGESNIAHSLHIFHLNNQRIQFLMRLNANLFTGRYTSSIPISYPISYYFYLRLINSIYFHLFLFNEWIASLLNEWMIFSFQQWAQTYQLHWSDRMSQILRFLLAKVSNSHANQTNQLNGDFM